MSVINVLLTLYDLSTLLINQLERMKTHTSLNVSTANMANFHPVGAEQLAASFEWLIQGQLVCLHRSHAASATLFINLSSVHVSGPTKGLSDQNTPDVENHSAAFSLSVHRNKEDVYENLSKAKKDQKKQKSDKKSGSVRKR